MMRIVDMSNNTEFQILERIKASLYFAIQLDESTDNSDAALFFIFCTAGEVIFMKIYCFARSFPRKQLQMRSYAALLNISRKNMLIESTGLVLHRSDDARSYVMPQYTTTCPVLSDWCTAPTLV